MQRRRFLHASAASAFASLALAGIARAADPDATAVIRSKILGDQRRINVALPPGYASSNARYAVLYLLDGGTKEDFPKISDIVARAVADGAVAPMIVVGIEGVDRKHDLTHPATFADDIQLLPQAGGAAAYRRFLVEELKPWVAARYRASDDSILVGESLAGLFVVETFLRQPQAFGAYLAASPSLWWDDQSLAKAAPELLRGGDFKGRRLYLSIGDEGSTMQEGVDRVVDALGLTPPADLTWRYQPMPGEHHDTIYDPSVAAGLRWLLPPR
ncbi:MAG: alpha/beta hydrolase [Caulobacter sp.]|nr:alpha/beta hydrolase [Caulobacter sp.]